jgi:hypothetical protein
VSSGSRQQAVVDAVRQWQTRLLQLDRRNALLYFRLGMPSMCSMSFRRRARRQTRTTSNWLVNGSRKLEVIDE